MPLPPAWGMRGHALAFAFAYCITGCEDDDRTAEAGPKDSALPIDAALDDAAFDARATLDSAAMLDGTFPFDADASATLDAGTTPDASVMFDDASADATPTPSFTMRVVVSGLASPWELTFGPDEALWTTERTGKRVTRVDPVIGAQTTLLELADVYQVSAQDGLLGLAREPDTDRVYLAYTYDANPGTAIDRRAKIVRYRYAATLIEPLVLLEGLPASSDHNAGRLVVGPDRQLYYSIGDQGKNQFGFKCEHIRAQELPSQDEIDAHDWRHYQGKILRLASDGSIPLDNPTLAGVRSHVFSYGHRNPQGLAFSADGTLHASEQGPKTDDELNQILPGRNYGWPNVAGLRDDRAYTYGDWSAASDCAQLEYSDYTFPDSVPRQAESAWSAADFMPPLRTFYTVDNEHDFTDALCAASPYICWPTIAPSSLDIYTSVAIPSWTGSFLLTSLKDGAVHRVAGSSVDEVVFRTVNRYRDLAIASDGLTFYVATDTGGDTRALDGSPTRELENRGAILAFRVRAP